MHPARTHSHDSQALAWEAAVSAWVDGEAEIRAEELDTPYGRQVWDTYHLIGDVLRTPDLAIQPSPMFYARLSHAIDDEPPLASPARPRRGWRAGLSGLAVAASVAAITWLVLPASQEPVATPEVAVPQLAAADVDDEAALHDYLEAHQGLVGVVPIRQVSYMPGGRP